MMDEVSVPYTPFVNIHPDNRLCPNNNLNCDSPLLFAERVGLQNSMECDHYGYFLLTLSTERNQRALSL